MITIFNKQKEALEILNDVTDYRQLLTPNQFIVSMKVDATHALHVLGGSRATIQPVYWNRGNNIEGKKIFKDWIITVIA